jgi:hypothetical protein
MAQAADSSRRVDHATEHTFTAEDVIVTVQDQTDGKTVRVQKDTATTDNAMYGQSDFYPRRMVINLRLDKDLNADKTAPAISPAALIQVKIKSEDITNAGGEGKIKMAYWHGGRWNVFGSKHGFKIEGGYAKAAMSVWGDPPLAMGP